MSIEIDWSPTTETLHALHAERTGYRDDWPVPQLDGSIVDDDERHRAREQWSDRIRATHLSLGRATELFRRLVALGAPVDILGGFGYICDELTHHLSTLTFLATPFETRQSIPAASDRRSPVTDRPLSWNHVFEETLELFAFDLALSDALYEAIGAISSDDAVEQLAFGLSWSTGELVGFGDEVLQWMVDTVDDATLDVDRLAAILGDYEAFCGGSPQLLDSIAGDELTIEARSGNLGTLDDQQIAVIFYDTLGDTILPLFERLDLDGHRAWRAHHQQTSPDRDRRPVVAAIGLPASSP